MSRKLVAASAVFLYAITLILIIVTFTTEYNLAQGIVLLFSGAITLGFAIVATVTAIALSLANHD